MYWGEGVFLRVSSPWDSGWWDSLDLFFFFHLAVLGLSCSMWTPSCGMWDLVPWPVIEPDCLFWEHGVLATGWPGKSPAYIIILWQMKGEEETVISHTLAPTAFNWKRPHTFYCPKRVTCAHLTLRVHVVQSWIVSEDQKCLVNSSNDTLYGKSSEFMFLAYLVHEIKNFKSLSVSPSSLGIVLLSSLNKAASLACAINTPIFVCPGC